MFGDALIAEVMFVSLTHHWFFKNIHTNGTMIIFVDNIFEPCIFIRLHCFI